MEERALATLYMERNFLAENEAFAWSLAKKVRERVNRCCVCGSKNVRMWILDYVYDAALPRSLIFARLFCEEHEKKWKEGEMLNYEIINGLLSLDMYQNPMELLIDVTWREFTNKFVSSVGKELTLQTLVDYLTKSSHLAYKGDIGKFLERAARAQELLERR